MNRRVQAVGYYGMGNFGDDLFREIITNNADRWWPGAAVRTWAPMKPGAYSRLDQVGQAVRLASGLAGMAWADTFVLGGGSVLHGASGSLQRLRRTLPVRRRFEALGVSLGPFEGNDRDDVMSFLDHFDRIVVRDSASVQRSGRHLPVGGDLAALATDLPTHDRVSRAVTVCPSAASGIAPQRLAWQIFSALSDRKTPVRVLALKYHPQLGDEDLCGQVARLLSEHGQENVAVLSYRHLGIKGVTRVLADSVAVWSQRLHGAVVAYLIGAPFLIVAHHAKCTDFAADIGLDPVLLVGADDGWELAASLTLNSTGEQAAVHREEYKMTARKVYLEEA